MSVSFYSLVFLTIPQQYCFIPSHSLLFPIPIPYYFSVYQVYTAYSLGLVPLKGVKTEEYTGKIRVHCRYICKNEEHERTGRNKRK